MEFGKVRTLKELDHISFDLPQRENREIKLTRLPQTSTGHLKNTTESPSLLYLGCPSWSNSNFLGKLYPETSTPQEYLFYYAQQFNSIELNTTFYRIPELKWVHQWRTSTPEGFKFCPKVFQQISRFENLYEIPKLTQNYISSIEAFGNRLGPSFMQLPPHFSTQYLPILRRFIKLIPQHIPLSIEFRHPSWFIQNRLIDPAYDLLSEAQISTVITDVAGRRDVLHQSLTHKTTIIRFVGNDLHPSDFLRLETWAKRLSSWTQDRMGPFYFFVHQPNERGYIELIQALEKSLSQENILKLKLLNHSIAQPQLNLFEKTEINSSY